MRTKCAFTKQRISACLKRFFFLAILALLGTSSLAMAADAVVTIPYPKPNYGTGKQKELIERGEYLTKAGDCIACHTDTKHHGKPFAGNYRFNTPFGVLYSPNITPDKETGIGNWSDEDFVRAMHKGVAPDGSFYYPAFPFTSFNKVSKEDILAIKAYLFSIPPIYSPKRENDMMWPFNWRFLQLGWRVMFFYFTDRNVYQYQPQHTAEWNRGAYLVQGLAHCGECHTPRNVLGAMKTKYYLTGAFVDGYYAPDITAQGLAGASKQEIVEVFTKNQMLNDAGKVEGPMEDVNRNSLQKLQVKDLENMVTYLQTVQSVQRKAATVTGPLSIEEGEDVYDTHCATCHATGGAGAPIVGNPADWVERLQAPIDTVYKRAINGYNSMPPKGTCMTCADEEIKAAVDYMLAASKPGSAGAAMKKPAPVPVRLTLAEGKKLYEANCASCHSNSAQNAAASVPQLGDKKAWRPLLAKNIDGLLSAALTTHPNLATEKICSTCSQADWIAAVKYLAQQSATDKDYSLW